MPRTIRIHDKTFVPYLEAGEIEQRVQAMAQQVSNDLREKNPLFLAILNGSFFFAADLLRHLDFLSEISFVKLASYSGTASTGEVRSLMGTDEELQGRHVVILEDIVDTGLTLTHLKQELEAQQPASIRVATLLFKPEAFHGKFSIDYTGFEIPEKFVVGYGLDYDKMGRNLRDIWQVKG